MITENKPKDADTALSSLEEHFKRWWHTAAREEKAAADRGEYRVAEKYQTQSIAYMVCAAHVAEMRRGWII